MDDDGQLANRSTRREPRQLQFSPRNFFLSVSTCLYQGWGRTGKAPTRDMSWAAPQGKSSPQGIPYLFLDPATIPSPWGPCVAAILRLNPAVRYRKLTEKSERENETTPSMAAPMASEARPKSDRVADPHDYSPLSKHGNIRLVRLIPHKDEKAPIQCQLLEYPLQELSQQATHLYEALSYVWGSEKDKQPIFIQPADDKGDNSSAGNIRCLHVTTNLHAALLHIRDRFFDRLLWIDAICINQKDNEEKGRQVQSMAKIYAAASRVIVWLGEAASDTDGALEMLCQTAAKGCIDPPARQSVIALLKRPWFQRIWVCDSQQTTRHTFL